MYNSEPVPEEETKKNCAISWMKILKIVICIIIVGLLFLLVKDFLFPKQEVTLNIDTPSSTRFSAIPGFERR